MDKVIELFKTKNKRLAICVGIIAVILATCQVVGHSIDTYLDLREIIDSVGLGLLAIIKIILYSLVIYFGIILITNLISKIKPKDNKEYKFLTANKRTFFLVWAIIFVMWIPYFLQYYPSLVSSDSIRQLMQVNGEMNYTTHHPLLHTLFIKMFVDIGSLLNAPIFGIALYSIVQMLLMSAIFAFTVYYMSKKKVPNVIRILALISFAIYPIHAIYSITMWKDILFGGAILLYTIWIYEFTQNREFIDKKRNIVWFIMLTLILIMFRKNGIFVTLFVAPFLLIIRKDKIKKVGGMIVVSLALYFIIHTALINIYNADRGEIREALAVPIQQLARVVKYQGDNLTENELAQIKKFIESDEIGKIYNPTLADPVKDCVNSKVFNENKLEFIGMWLKLLIKYPIDYIEAFLCNSYGYWYPDAQNWVTLRENGFGENILIDTKIVPYIDSLIDRRDIPILTNLFSIGSNVWAMLITFTICVYKKQYKVLIAFVPVITIVLTSMASPVFCELRYVYGLFTTLPFLLAITYQKFREIS